MIRWLDQIQQEDLPLVGGKAANLGAMTQAGFPVPPGFCLTTTAWHSFVQANRLGETLQQATKSPKASAHARDKIVHAPMPPAIADAVRSAYEALAQTQNRVPHAGEPDVPVAIRSSATSEDLPTASFAGQQDSFLHVTGLDNVLHHIQDCWASAWTDRAVQYRKAKGTPETDLATVVQVMIPCNVSGVAFSRDPLTGEDVVVIEAARGLGDALMNGQTEPLCYRVPATNPVSIATPGEQSLLTAKQVNHLTETVRQLAAHFERPQDIEWGYFDNKLFVFQSRPITVQEEPFFNQQFPDDDRLWVAGFLNERFSQPVSPLGWSLVRSLLEPLAYRDPLHYLGVHDLDGQPFTRLYRGHPYTDAGVFWRIYKLFPDALLPEDVARYFPNGNTALRKEVTNPHWSPGLLWTLFRALSKNWQNVSPLHNWRAWQRFIPRHQMEMEHLRNRVDQGIASLAESPADSTRRRAAWDLMGVAQQLNERLLAYHRWSLVHADLAYTFLRRLCLRLFGHEAGSLVTAQQITRLPTRSFQLDQSLQHLVRQVRDYPLLQDALRVSSWEEVSTRLRSLPQGPAFTVTLEQFLADYGHRAFSLDIFQPSFRDEPEQVLALIRDLAQERDHTIREKNAPQLKKEKPWLLWPLRPLIRLTQRYVLLREEQRFLWQQTLALQRRLVVRLGDALAYAGTLANAEDIFFLTLEEVDTLILEDRQISRFAQDWKASGNGEHRSKGSRPHKEWAKVARRRRAAYEVLCQEQSLAPELTYPEFLRGNIPVQPKNVCGNGVLQGQPVSPGVGRGPVRVVRAPNEFDKLRPGDILVTTSPDPGWTPVFGIVAGLVTERGGQLSHGAVVAREYGLPAVAGLPGITGTLHDEEWVVVDGRTGTVQRVNGQRQ